MGMAASQARFLQLTARKTNIEHLGQQINQQRLSLANANAGLFEKLLSIALPTPPSSQDDKYYTQGYNFVDPRDDLQKKIHWQTYDEAIVNGAPTADSYYAPATGLDIQSVVDGTVHSFPAAVVAHPTDAQKADILTCLGIDTTSEGSRQEIRYTTIENPILTPDGALSTHNEQGISVLEFDNLNRLLKVTSLTDKPSIVIENNPNFSSSAPTSSTTGAVSGFGNDGIKVAGAAVTTPIYTPWVESGNYTVDTNTNIATQTYTRDGSQQVDAGSITSSRPVTPIDMTDLNAGTKVANALTLDGVNFNQYTYVDHTGDTVTRLAIGDVDAAQAKAQLAAIGNDTNSLNKNFILMNDNTDLTGIAWKTIGTASQGFSGIFDGNQKTILKMKIDLSGQGNQMYQGMFGKITGTYDAATKTYTKGVVKGITLKDAFIKLDSASLGIWQGYVGGIAGMNDGGLVENCNVKNINIDVAGDAQEISALVGHVRGANGKVDKSSATGAIHVGSYAGDIGGLVGWLQGGTVTRSSADVAITIDGRVNYGAVFIGDGNGSFSNCYSMGSITAAGPKLNFSGNLTGDNGSTIENSYQLKAGTYYVYNNNVQIPSSNTTDPQDFKESFKDAEGYVDVNGVSTPVWLFPGDADNPNAYPILNIDAVNVEETSSPGHTTDNWTETFNATAAMPTGALSLPFSIGDGNALTYVGQFDSVSYYSDVNKYEFQQAAYDFQIESINQNTKRIQAQDKSLELKMRQLDTEHNAVQTEMESVQKVISKNIEGSFKTFA